MKGVALALLVSVAMLLVACSGSQSSVRVNGRLTASGGTSSHVFPGYPGLVRAEQNGRTIASVGTEPDGSFDLRLKPGSYVFIGGWKDVCGAPCNWQAGCAQTDPTTVGGDGLRDLQIRCALK
jgi:hypothetical protein